MVQVMADLKHVNTDISPDVFNRSVTGWEAELELIYEISHGKTVLKHNRHRGPLMVQRALYPEGGVCYTHILHPPGGVVGGDILDINVNSGANSQVLLTTPGATRFYRSDGRVSHVSQKITVAPDARLEWLPLENIAFPCAMLNINTEIHLSSSSQFVSWDIWTLGQPATNTPFGKGSINGTTHVFVDNKRLLCERLRVNPETMAFSATSLRDKPVCGTIIVHVGGVNDGYSGETLCETLNVWWAQERQSPTLINEIVDIGITQFDGLLVIRGLAGKNEVLFQLFVLIWQQIRFHWTGMTPEIPRIWRT